MFQVLLQYFEDRYASFYVQNPITDFTELLERVRKAGMLVVNTKKFLAESILYTVMLSSLK